MQCYTNESEDAASRRWDLVNSTKPASPSFKGKVRPELNFISSSVLS